ncbi:hypothetical protein GCM10010452_13770 [Crossiella cryophila]
MPGFATVTAPVLPAVTPIPLPGLNHFGPAGKSVALVAERIPVRLTDSGR